MNTLDEMCYIVALTKEFQQDATPLRASFGIPVDGFKDEKAYTAWYAQNTLDRNNEFYSKCAELVTKYRLPPDANIRLKEYVLFGTSGLRPESLDIWMPMDELAVCDIELSDKTAQQWDKSGIPFVRLIVSDHATQADVKRYVSSRWKLIQTMLNVQRGGAKKRLVRAVRNRGLNEEMLRLNKLKLSELRKLAPEGIYDYKESAIAAIINEHSNEKVTAANVKKIIYRRNKIRDTER